MDRTISDLDGLIQLLGLEVKPKGKKILKKDYINTLRSHYLWERYPDGDLPANLYYILQIESPMLAQRYSYLKPDEQTALWTSDNFLFQKKEDGVRILVLFNKSQGFSYYSRNVSVIDFCPIEYDNIWIEGDFSKLPYESFCIDTELISETKNINTILNNKGVVTETCLQAVTALLSIDKEQSLEIQRSQDVRLMFQVFDCLMLNGDWIMQNDLLKRIAIAENISKDLFNCGMRAKALPFVRDNKKKFYDSVIETGGEGVIAKSVNSIYRPVEARGRLDWVKIKRSIGDSLTRAGGDCLDAFVTGFELGTAGKAHADKVGSLKFSVLLRKDNGDIIEHEIASIAGIEEALRNEITTLDLDGKPTLKQEYYGRVAEIDGQDISARNFRISHAVFKHWRPDKGKNGCIVNEGFLRSLIL